MTWGHLEYSREIAQVDKEDQSARREVPRRSEECACTWQVEVRRATLTVRSRHPQVTFELFKNAKISMMRIDHFDNKGENGLSVSEKIGVKGSRRRRGVIFLS